MPGSCSPALSAPNQQLAGWWPLTETEGTSAVNRIAARPAGTLVNGVAWVTKLEIPKDGVPSKTPDKAALEKVMDDAKAAIEGGK